MSKISLLKGLRVRSSLLLCMLLVRMMNMANKNIICSVMTLLFVWTGVAHAAPVVIPAPPQLAATAYLLIDADTGKILVEKNADEPVPPASLTKMLTSYIVSEEIYEGRLDEQQGIRVSENAWRKGGAKSGSSTMFLKPNSEVSAVDLLRGVIIQSGNDASIALAEHIAGSEESFADIMNQQAKLLGMNDSHFVNSTGWPAEGHMTTARDLSVLAKAVINDHPDHYGMYSERNFEHNGINQSNRNKLLFSDRFVDGLKTGHTEEAGYCLVASAKKEGMRLISVVMGAKSKSSRATESQRLLSYGFRYFATHKLYSVGDVLSKTRVWSGENAYVDLTVAEDVIATIPRGSEKELVAETQVDKVVKAPLSAGQELGRLVIQFDGKELASAPLVAAAAVEQSGFFARTWDALMLMIQGD